MSQANYEFKREFENVFSGYKAMHPHSTAGWLRGVHTSLYDVPPGFESQQSDGR